MKDEYIIINKTAIQKRIEELEKWNYMQEGATTYRSPMHLESSRRQIIQNKEVILELKQILSQSTPLIPEIEKAFTAGERYGWDSQKSIGNIDEMREKIKLQSLDNYISNLKLDI